MKYPFPMLAAQQILKEEDLQSLQYPIYGTPKKDGIRAHVVWKDRQHRMLSRTNKPIPNMFIEEWCADNELPIGCDGELVVQNKLGDADFHECQSKIMTAYSVPFEWTYYVFDDADIDMHDAGYYVRAQDIRRRLKQGGHLGNKVEWLKPTRLDSPAYVLFYYEEMVKQGNEGIILRSRDGRYKEGRCTFNEGLMLKLKARETREAVIIGFVERYENTNTGKRNNVGQLKRPKRKSGLKPTGLLGAFVMRDIETDVEFKCSGFTEAFAKHVWENKHQYYNKIASYEKLIHGEKDKPREPKFKGIRDPRDMV